MRGELVTQNVFIAYMRDIGIFAIMNGGNALLKIKLFLSQVCCAFGVDYLM